MKKFFHAQNGKEVKLGDVVEFTHKKVTPFGNVISILTTTLNEKTLNLLIKKGEIKVVDEEKETCKNYGELWSIVVTNIINKTEWKIEKLDTILATLEKVNPWAVTQIFLKEIAIELDKKYKDHINDSEHIFVVSPQDGRIHELDKSYIKSYKAFPAFRTIEDAKIACYLMRNNLKEIFNNAKKQ